MRRKCHKLDQNGTQLLTPKQQEKDHYSHSWKCFFPLLFMKEMWGQESFTWWNWESGHQTSEYQQIKSTFWALFIHRNCQRRSSRTGASLSGHYQPKTGSYWAFIQLPLGWAGCWGCQSWEHSVLPNTAHSLAQSPCPISFLERITNNMEQQVIAARNPWELYFRCSQVEHCLI